MLKGIFGNGKAKDEPRPTPEAFMPKDPVNYNSVLDYLVGLSKSDYTKMIKSADIYREANAKVAKVVGVKDEPTTSLKNDQPEITDEDLDDLLENGMNFIDEGPGQDKPKKAQSPNKKIEVQE